MDKKKILIILAVLILVIAGVVMLYLFQGNKTPRNKVNTVVPTPIGQSNPGELPQVNKQTFPDYSVGVPENMNTQLLSNSSGGTTLVMKPKEDNASNASISVQQTDASVSSLEKQQGIFNTLGHTGTSIYLGGTTGTKFTNAIPIGGGQNLYESVVIFQKGNIVYQIRLTYQGSSQNQNLEIIYSQVLGGFSTN